MRPERLFLTATALLSMGFLAVTSSAQAFKHPDSDQKGCFDTAGSAIPCAGTGQDGAYIENPMSFTDKNDGTIADNNTGLIWQKDTSAQVHDRTSAATYCDSLVLAGAVDWRLPTKKELMGLLDYNIPDPGPLFPSLFPVSSNYYWASTLTTDGASAWHAFVCWGNIDTAYLYTNMSARCVRGAETPGPVLITNGADTVTDTRTGLDWQRGEPGPKTWADALTYCESLNLGGSTAWRLPNIKELESIVDVTKSNPAMDTTVFPGATSANYWSSTTHWARNDAWRVDFTQGLVNGSLKTDALNVRCVRTADTGPPTITAVSPASGTSAGGTLVTITGTNLTGVTSVTFGGTAATAVTAVSSTSVTCTTPAKPAGAVDVVVTTSAGTATKTGAYTYTMAIALSNNLAAEYAAAGTVIGTLSTVGGDVGDSFTYALATGTGDSDNDSFEIDGNELRVLLALDFKVKNPYSIRVRSTGSGGSAIEAAFTISTPAYALWTRSDSGQAVLWQIDPSLPTGAAQLKRSVPLYSSSGIGAPWQATSFAYVSATQAYVLWTRGDTGRAVLWQIDPSLPTGAAQLKRSVPLYSSSGIGAPWQATSYAHVSATEGYVLWTQSGTWRAVLWQIDPSLPTGAAQLKRSVPLYSTPGIATPWQATGYTHVSATEGYVLLTHGDTGRAVLWQIDPSLPTGPAQLTRAVSLYSSSGVGAPWQSSSLYRVGPVTASSPDARDWDELVDELPPTDIEPW